MYSPTNLTNQKGYFTLIIKVYRENPEFPGGGKFS